MSEIWTQIHTAHPLVHAITNPVTMTNVVNMILAAGGTAICADNEKEAEDIVKTTDGLLLNIGMPDENRRRAMLRAGKAANQMGIPVVLDPVGAGASRYRMSLLEELLAEVHFSCIRGNMSEIAALAGMTFSSHGVEDAGVTVSEDAMQRLSARYQTALAVTGETDYAVSPERVFTSRTGTPMLKRITGAGCMLSGLTASLLAALAVRKAGEGKKSAPDPDAAAPYISDLLQEYGRAAEETERLMRKVNRSGTASFSAGLIDTISRMSGVWRAEEKTEKTAGK